MRNCKLVEVLPFEHEQSSESFDSLTSVPGLDYGYWSVNKLHTENEVQSYP